MKERGITATIFRGIQNGLRTFREVISPPGILSDELRHHEERSVVTTDMKYIAYRYDKEEKSVDLREKIKMIPGQYTVEIPETKSGIWVKRNEKGKLTIECSTRSFVVFEPIEKKDKNLYALQVPWWEKD